MGEKLNIVFGFEETKFQKSIERTLAGLGYDVNIVCKYSKNSVADFLRNNREFTHAVLKENFNRSKYSDVELAELTEERDINIIVVLSKAHKGTAFMETLYAAGITGALFMEGNESDATVQTVSNLILHKRKRQEARKYYGMGDKVNVRLNSISDGKLSDLLQSLDDVSYGADIGKRFAQLCTSLSPKQVVDFIVRMPKDTKATLEKYDDYWMVITALEAHGVTIKSKQYQQGIRNFSKRARVKAAQDKVSIDDKSLNKEYVPQGNVYTPESARATEPPAPEEPEDLYASNDVDNSDLFESGGTMPEQPVMPQMQQPQMSPQIPPQMPTQQMPYQQPVQPMQAQMPYQQPMQMPYQQPVQQMPYQQPMQQPYSPYQQPVQPMQAQMPPVTNVRELKRREKQAAKEAKKQAKIDAKNKKYKKLNSQSPQLIQPSMSQMEQQDSPAKTMQFTDNTPITNLHPKREKDETKKKELLIRLGIVFAVIAFIALVIVVSMGVNYMTKTNAMEDAKEQELLNEQMNDLAEIRSGQAIDVSNVVPVTAAVTNGEQIMGVQVMDIINTDLQLYYVVNTDGSLFTYEGGGATSNEVDVNSMYYAQMLTSGRFAFYQQ